MKENWGCLPVKASTSITDSYEIIMMAAQRKRKSLGTERGTVVLKFE